MILLLAFRLEILTTGFGTALSDPVNMLLCAGFHLPGSVEALGPCSRPCNGDGPIR
jgi:hypothetical protein